MKNDLVTSEEVQAFVAAITDLFWGSRWSDVRSLAEQSWVATGLSPDWDEIEPEIEAGWYASHASTGNSRVDQRLRASPAQHDLFVVLARVHHGNASAHDLARVDVLSEGLLDASDPALLTRLGHDVLGALQVLVHVANASDFGQE